MNRYLSILVSAATMIVAAAFVNGSNVLAFKSSYQKLLEKQGYHALKAPRTNFGPGTILPVDQRRNLYTAAPKECFPGLDEFLQDGQTKLLDEHDEKNLSINASGQYSPGGTSTLQKIAAAFGFASNSKLDVKFGETSSVDLTKVGFEKYLAGRSIPKTCVDELNNPKNQVIFSMAVVKNLTYQFVKQKNVSGSVNADALKQALSAQGDVKYTSNSTDTLEITQPMYVGYNAFRLQDLRMSIPESSGGSALIMSGRLVRARAKLPGE